MRKVKFLPYLCIAAIILFFAITLSAVFSSGGNLYAEAARESDNYIAGYNAVYDIRADRTMTVTEDLTFHFDGKSGFVRDIPVNGGEKVQNIRVKELDGATEKNVYYDVYSDDDERGNAFLCVDMGSGEVKYGNYTFRLTYDYIVPASAYEKKHNTIALAPVGGGYGFKVKNIDIKLLLPDGYIGDSLTFCYIDDYAQTRVNISEDTENGRTALSVHVDELSSYTGLRFDVHFKEGVLSSHFDFTPYIIVLVSVALLLLLLFVKLMCFGRRPLTPIVNFEAPDKMNPLAMGKLIDTRVNQEDITSMIFYFADKGYLKINLKDENNPTLIRIVKNLPEDCPAYERLMFENLFAQGDMVKTSSLANKFYKTVEKVTAAVNSSYKGFYTSKSMVCALVFAILGGLLLGIAPFALAFFTISSKLLVVAPFISLVPALVIFGLCQTLKWYELKYSKKKKIIFVAVIALLCVVLCFVYALFVPSWILGFWQKFLIAAVSASIVTLSVTLISRSKEYDGQLNEIVGFKNFIQLAEKSQLETMINDDPQFYYHVLPYAQVLGVSDIWTEKFKDITLEPPKWATSSVFETAFRISVFNSVMNNMASGISKNLTSRPSSSGASGGGHGSFGGFSGGGHGGGGGHFR